MSKHLSIQASIDGHNSNLICKLFTYQHIGRVHVYLHDSYIKIFPSEIIKDIHDFFINNCFSE